MDNHPAGRSNSALSERIYAPAPNLTGELLGDEYLVLDGDSGHVYRLNSSSTLVLGLCDGARTAEEIIELIADAFPDASPALRDEVIIAFGKLESQGLLVRA